MKKILFALIILTSFLTCSKQDNPTAANGTSATVDLIKLPLTIGTWWKYVRLDSSNTSIYLSLPQNTTDSSQEIYTVMGKTQFSTGRPVYLWQIQNITHNKFDTVYAFYSSDSLILYDKTNLTATYNTPYFATPLHFNNSPYTLAGILAQYLNGVDTVFHNTDTSINIYGKIYDHDLYINHTYFCVSNAPSGVGCSYNVTSTFIAPGIGLLTFYTYKRFGGALTSITTNTTTKRLIDYKIAP